MLDFFEPLTIPTACGKNNVQFYEDGVSKRIPQYNNFTHSINDSINKTMTRFFWEFQSKIALSVCCTILLAYFGTERLSSATHGAVQGFID